MHKLKSFHLWWNEFRSFNFQTTLLISLQIKCKSFEFKWFWREKIATSSATRTNWSKTRKLSLRETLLKGFYEKSEGWMQSIRYWQYFSLNSWRVVKNETSKLTTLLISLQIKCKSFEFKWFWREKIATSSAKSISQHIVRKSLPSKWYLSLSRIIYSFSYHKKALLSLELLAHYQEF